MNENEQIERDTDKASIRRLTEDNERLRAELAAIRPAYVSCNGEVLRLHVGQGDTAPLCGGTAPLRDDELAEIECPRCGAVDADGWRVLLVHQQPGAPELTGGAQ